jgi:hypothetical protein
MNKENVELAITISSIILFLSSEVLGKFLCESTSVIDIFIGIASRCRKKVTHKILDF